MLPVLFSIGPVTIYTFGIFALIGFFFASFFVWKRGLENHFSEEDIFDAIVIVSLAGLLGARLSFILLNFDRFGFSLLNWLSFFRIPGFLFIGGLLTGLLTLRLMSKKKYWDYFSITDVMFSGLCFGQAVGWIGAFFSGFGVGWETEYFGLNFVGYDNPRFPMQLILSIGFFIIFIFLWRIEERYRTFDWYKGKKTSAQSGFLTFSYLMGYGLLTLLVNRYNVLVLIIGMLGIYLRSGRELGEDIRNLGSGVGSNIRRRGLAISQSSRRIKTRIRQIKANKREKAE